VWSPALNFAFNFNLRRYTNETIALHLRVGDAHQLNTGRDGGGRTGMRGLTSAASYAAAFKDLSQRTGQGLTLVHFSAQLERFLLDRGCI
jgi:hypothetical protein